VDRNSTPPAPTEWDPDDWSSHLSQLLQVLTRGHEDGAIVVSPTAKIIGGFMLTKTPRLRARNLTHVLAAIALSAVLLVPSARDAPNASPLNGHGFGTSAGRALPVADVSLGDSAWYGFDDGSKTAGRVASVIAGGGGLGDALTALTTAISDLGDGLPPETISAIAGILADPEVIFDPEAAISTLLDVPGLTAADKIADPGLASPPDQTPAAFVSATASSVPAQARNGQTKATGDYSWLLHNSHDVKVYYGWCDQVHCETDGYLRVDWWADLYYGDDFNFGLDNFTDEGQSVSMSNASVAMRRDINNFPDITTKTLDCPTNGYNNYRCFANPSIPHSTGDWYYLRWKFKGTFGSHSQDFDIQTRRAKVTSIDPYNDKFPAHDLLGG
jgi:hypothetical protein